MSAKLETFYFDEGKTTQVINASVGAFSRFYTAPLNGEILFYTETPNPDPTKPPVKVPIAQATLPPKKPGPFLILLAPGPSGAAPPLTSLVIDDSLAVHPPSVYRIFNFSKRRLAVRLADTNLVLASGQSDEVPYPNARKAWLKVAADEQSDGWLLVSSSPHAVGVNSRTTLFLVDIPPSPRDPDPKGIVARRMLDNIYADKTGALHIR